MNRVEIMGKVSHLDTSYQEVNGENILVLRFAVDIEREGDKTHIDHIPCRIEGNTAEQVQNNIANGDTVSIKGRWNVDAHLQHDGNIIHYCTCIPQVLMVQEKTKRSDDLLIR